MNCFDPFIFLSALLVRNLHAPILSNWSFQLRSFHRISSMNQMPIKRIVVQHSQIMLPCVLLIFCYFTIWFHISSIGILSRVAYKRSENVRKKPNNIWLKQWFFAMISFQQKLLFQSNNDLIFNSKGSNPFPCTNFLHWLYFPKMLIFNKGYRISNDIFTWCLWIWKREDIP